MTAALDHLIAFWLHFWPIALLFFLAQIAESAWNWIRPLTHRRTCKES